jgi:hypothetical protein
MGNKRNPDREKKKKKKKEKKKKNAGRKASSLLGLSVTRK